MPVSPKSELIDVDEEIQPLLMSQMFICSSPKQRLSMAKYMISNNLAEDSTIGRFGGAKT